MSLLVNILNCFLFLDFHWIYFKMPLLNLWWSEIIFVLKFTQFCILIGTSIIFLFWGVKLSLVVIYFLKMLLSPSKNINRTYFVYKYFTLPTFFFWFEWHFLKLWFWLLIKHWNALIRGKYLEYLKSIIIFFLIDTPVKCERMLSVLRQIYVVLNELPRWQITLVFSCSPHKIMEPIWQM